MNPQDSGSAVNALVPRYIRPQYDDILEITRTVGDVKIKLTGPTSMVAGTLFSPWKNFLTVLLEIIEGQGKQLEFDGYYISYLLGHITERQFKGISKKFVVEKKVTDPEQIKTKVQMLTALRGHDITVKEMAQYLHCDEAAVTKALALLQG